MCEVFKPETPPGVEKLLGRNLGFVQRWSVGAMAKTGLGAGFSRIHRYWRLSRWNFALNRWLISYDIGESNFFCRAGAVESKSTKQKRLHRKKIFVFSCGYRAVGHDASATTVFLHISIWKGSLRTRCIECWGFFGAHVRRSPRNFRMFTKGWIVATHLKQKEICIDQKKKMTLNATRRKRTQPTGDFDKCTFVTTTGEQKRLRAASSENN